MAALETREYVIAIRNAREPDLALSNADRKLLRVAIPAEGRLQQNLIQALRLRLGTNDFCICEVRSGIIHAEVLDPAWKPLGMDLTWEANQQFVPEDRSLIEERPPVGLFAAPGWMEMIKAWIRPCLKERGLRLTGEFDQYCGFPSAALIRFNTTGKAVWLKATTGIQTQEMRITEVISELYRMRVPNVFAVNRDWNTWLMEDAPGRTLADFDAESQQGMEAWRQVANALGSLQSASGGDEAKLLAAGCADWRPRTVLQKLDEFFVFGKLAMRKQPAGGPQVLTDTEIDEISEATRMLLSELDREPLPNTLMHGDLNFTNIIVGQEGVTFIDWAEAWVSHPVFGYEYIAAHFRRVRPAATEAEVSSLRTAYLDSWPRSMSWAMERAFDKSSPLALLTYAVDAAQPRNRRGNGAQQEKCIRSYLRQLHRELRALHQEVA